MKIMQFKFILIYVDDKRTKPKCNTIHLLYKRSFPIIAQYDIT